MMTKSQKSKSNVELCTNVFAQPLFIIQMTSGRVPTVLEFQAEYLATSTGTMPIQGDLDLHGVTG